MRYRVEMDQNSLLWRVGDKPNITGTITGNGAVPTLLGVTVRMFSALGEFLSERVATYTALDGTFESILPNKFDQRITQGVVYVAALEDSAATRTLDAELSASALTAEISGATGTPQASGYALIDSEWVEYTYSGTTLTIVARGVFNTTAAIHSVSSTVSFMSTKETAQPTYRFNISDDMELYQQ